MKPKPQNLVIIDGHNFLWRAYSVPFKFISPKGTPLHVVTTYLKLLRRAIASVQGFSGEDLLVVVFDTDTLSANHELSADYKANRKIFSVEEESPFKHLPHVKKALSLLEIPYLEIENVEADDVIATLSKKCTTNGGLSYIVSADTDFYQLLCPQVSIVKLKPQDEVEIIDENYLHQKLGISPSEYVYYKSLIGDTADNIKGVPGIGPITARKIIQKTKAFDEEMYGELLDLNRRLITLNQDIVLEQELGTFIYKDHIIRLTNKEIFEKCEF